MFDNIFNFAELKKAYKQAARKAHPDMGGTTEEMQRVNAEYEKAVKRIQRNGERFAQDAEATGTDTAETNTGTATAEDMMKFAGILQNIIILEGLTIEIVGSWLWVSGDTYKHREILKASGLKWSNKHKAWYWHEEGAVFGRSRKGDTLNDIKARHGSSTVRTSCKLQYA